MLWSAYHCVDAGFSLEFLQLVVYYALLMSLGGLVNNECGQLHVHELQVAIQRSKAKPVSQRPADFIW